MASVSIIHYTHKVNSDGTSPISIQVIVNRKPKKRTLANVLPEHWDDAKKRVKPKTHPNYNAINLKISSEFNRIDELIINNSFNLDRDFIKYFHNLKAGVTDEEPGYPIATLSFKQIIPLYVSSLKSGHSMVAYEAKLNFFADKAELGDLRVSEITKAHIDKFVKYHEGKGNQRSTIRTGLKIPRFLSSFAEKNGYDKKSKDLHAYKLPKENKSIKSKLDKADLLKFASAKLTGKMKEVQDMFMLAVYLRGMRISDVIQIKQAYFKQGRYIYASSKTEHQFNIKLVPEAVEIVNRYLDGREYLFTFFKFEHDKFVSGEENLKRLANHIKSITAIINGQLKEIAEKAKVVKNISTHIARHTFAKMAIDAVKGDLNMSMDLVGHSDLAEHQKYIMELTRDEEMDKAADDIFK